MCHKNKIKRCESKKISASTPAQTLEEALQAGDAAQVKKLLEQGANPNTEISGVGPALLFACTSQDIKSAKALLQAKANVNAVGPTGLTPLMMSSLLGNSELVQLLVQAGADVNHPHLINGNPSGLSALKMTQNNRFDELCNC